MATSITKDDIKALTFDIFGTCVDWRTSVTTQLYNAAQKATSASTVAPETAEKAKSMPRSAWEQITNEWRQTYYAFTRELASNPNATFKTVDQHHHDALIILLANHGLTGLWTDAELHHLAQAWHRLDSWPDTNEGLEILGRHFQTATLSNGNVSLLEDMQAHSGMRFTHTFSAEMFGTYKPNPKVYLGAAEKLGVEPGEVAMVAAHLYDFRAAKGNGLRTIYVEREGEDTVDQEEARREGYVDLWIKLGDGGFLGVTKALGIS
ncbi:haloacid dehalogenase, type II [Elsinoe ampelina]|uniref:Haloacid dehalogenase, type II n=1 Tax=Elsinoe ampelina TaxID=302913 RepID=A0A6A6GR24_9PEZI|nr:haloacid dehalogenase, type II [Elsinoe ampelina]